MKKIFLASKSPRRKKILEGIGLEFDIVDSTYDEQLDSLDFSYNRIESLALNKVLGALGFVGDDSVVIGADTVVVLDKTILPKPKDYKDAHRMLSLLSNNTHNVVTAICVYDTKNKNYLLESVTTELDFFELTEEMIKEYITNFKPYDKAGAYGIQELPEGFVKSVRGDVENVIGLSSKAVQSMLQRLL